MFDGKADVVDLVLRHFIYGACGLGTAHFDAAISCVQYAPAGDVIAAGDSDGRIHFIGKMYFVDPTAGEIKSSLRGHTDCVWSVCFSPDGTKIVSGSSDETVLIWDAASGEQL